MDETPAPGHYDTGILAAYSLNARACMTGNKYIKEGKGSFMTSLHDDRSAPNMTEVTVDPTHYSDYYLQKESVGACSKASPNVLIRDGKLGFSSNIPRCVDAQFEDRSPLRGPGTYDYYKLYGCGVTIGAAASNKGTTAFTNAAPLLGYIRNTDTPGAGEYDVKKKEAKEYTYSNKGSSAFAGTTARCGGGIPTCSAVGPEKYVLDHHSIERRLEAEKNPRLPPFGSSSRRL